MVTEFVHNNPDRVDRMILIASSGEYNLDPLRKAGLNMPVPLMRLAHRFTSKWLFAPFHVLKPWFRNTLSKWNGWSMMRDITVPSLVIRGHRDRIFSTHAFEEVARVLPSAEEVDVGVSGHMVMLERRDAVNRAVKRFLEESPRSWRESSLSADDSTRVELVRERPWLKHYESGVPYTVAIPNILVQQLLRSATRRFPLYTAIRYEGRRITYLRLDQEVNRFANTLRSLDVDQGDRVMLLMPNIPQMVIGFYGALKAGAVPVFTLPNTPVDELIRKVRDSGTKVLVAINQFWEIARQAKDEAGTQQGGPLEHIIFTSVTEYLPLYKRIGLWFDAKKRASLNPPVSLEDGMHEYHQILYTHRREPPEIDRSADDLAAIVYTGGTTADPKGVMLSHRNLVANTLQTRHWLPDAKEGSERCLSVIPFSHIYGL
ncbi:MAG: AMP-binding protein, partial [Anaerolineales bacterium]